MLAVINSCSLLGLEGYNVQVEVDVAPGLPAFDIVGLPDTSIRESKERVRAAIKNSGFNFPPKRVTVNLAPADTKKEGPIFDLPIALGILAATQQLNPKKLNEICVLGELSLSGELRRVNGVLVMASSLKGDNIKSLMVPSENSQEAAIASGVKVFGLKSLREVVDFLNFNQTFSEAKFIKPETKFIESNIDFSDIVGQYNAKRALEIAAAGGHNVLLVGPPGSGKTMLARALVGILPQMTLQESIELTKIYSISGLLPKDNPLMTERPFRSPHHNASVSSLIGGGSIPKPGEVTLANFGVLFLDELTEYPKRVLESLRQPLEDGEVLISRVAAAIKFPARFSLIGAINPCPCGYLGDNTKECSCTPYQIKKYFSKISGPLVDRFDMQVHVPRVNKEELQNFNNGDQSSVIKKRVEGARLIQRDRLKGKNNKCNSELDIKEMKKYCVLTGEAAELYEQIYDKHLLTMRSYGKILKVARTIADLENEKKINTTHVAERIAYHQYFCHILEKEILIKQVKLWQIQLLLS